MQEQIRVTDDLVIELWPAAPGDSADRPLLKLRSLAAGRDGEDRAVIVDLPEVRHLVAARDNLQRNCKQFAILQARFTAYN